MDYGDIGISAQYRNVEKKVIKGREKPILGVWKLETVIKITDHRGFYLRYGFCRLVLEQRSLNNLQYYPLTIFL